MTEHEHRYAPVETKRRDIIILVCAGCGDSIVKDLPRETAPVLPFVPRPQPFFPRDPLNPPWRYPYRPPLVWCVTPQRHGKTTDRTSDV